jgi:hypothetical protein
MDFDCKLPMFRTWVVGIDLGRSGVQVEGYHPRPFGMRGGCTVPPWPRFPRPPDNPGRPNFSSNMFLRTYDAVKPAVRDDREGDGNGGIIRSPSRATALPGNPRPKHGGFFAEEYFQPHTGVLVQFAFLTFLTLGMGSGR